MHPFERWIFNEEPSYSPLDIRIKLAPFSTRYYFLIFNIKKKKNKPLYIQYNKKVSWAKSGKGENLRGKYRENRIPFRAYNVSEGSETNTVVAIFSTGRFFLRFFYHESEENHARLNVGRPRKSIDLLRAKSISIREERGNGGGEWVVVESWTRGVNAATRL